MLQQSALHERVGYAVAFCGHVCDILPVKHVAKPRRGGESRTGLECHIISLGSLTNIAPYFILLLVIRIRQLLS